MQAKLMPTKLLLLAGVVYLLAGCVTYFASSFVQQLYALIKNQGVNASALFVEADMGLVDVDGELLPIKPFELLHHLEAGQLWRHANNIQRSIQQFDMAELFFADSDTQNVIAETYNVVATTLGGDGDYAANPFERVLVNFYKAINYWSQGDFAATRVEFNRSYERTQIAVERYQEELEDLQQQVSDSEVNYDEQQVNAVIAENYPEYQQWQIYEQYVNPAVLFMHAHFLKSGDSSDRSQAENLLQRAYALVPDNPVIEQELEQLITGQTNDDGYTTIVFESGISPTVEETRVDLPIPLPSGVVLIAYALPRINPDSATTVNPSIAYLDAASDRITAPQFYPLAESIVLMQTEMRYRMPIIILQAITESVVKAGAQLAINEASDDSLFAGFVNLLTSTIFSATTSADTRKWITTPNRWLVARIPNSAIQQGQLVVSSAGNEPVTITVTNAAADNLLYLQQITSLAQPRATLLATE